LTVIGVVDNVRERSLRDEPPPHVYVPLSVSPDGWLRLLARNACRSGALVASRMIGGARAHA